MTASPTSRELAVRPAVRFAGWIRQAGANVLAALVGKTQSDTRTVTLAVASSVAALGMAVAALVMPVVAGAHRGDGVFTLAEGRSLRGLGDVAMLGDNSIVGVVTSGGWRMTPDRRQSPIPGFAGTGVAATADGGAVAREGDTRLGGHRILRWTPGAGVSVVAGTGEPGFGGDGGAATEALLDLEPGRDTVFAPPPTGIVARPDGGFAFADTGNGRIRAVDAAGIIRTTAGGLPGALRNPVGLAATPDGGYLVTEAWTDLGEGTGEGTDLRDEGTARVRRVGADGRITTVAFMTADDVVVAADGTAVIAEHGGRLWRLRPGSRKLRPYLRPRRPTATFDFAARTIAGWNVALDQYGGLLVAGDRVLTYVPGGPTPWTLAALRSTRTSRHAVAAVIETTQPGTATLEVSRRGQLVARDVRPVPIGHSTLRATAPIRSEWYHVRLQLKDADGRTARDQVPIHGARALTERLARRLLGHRQGWPGDADIFWRLGSDCRRFGSRRVDCAIVETGRNSDRPGSAIGVASVTLERTGIVLRRNYEWGQHGFQRHPRFLLDSFGDAVQRLSPGRGGKWDYR